MKIEDEGIDIVLTWVDGNDPAWKEVRSRYSEDGDASEVRFRDWGLLRYWFRGVEKNAPFIRKIHFVTWGHLPSWLNVSHPKLHIVRHEDFIPQEYLPTFNSHTIELNMHRIEGLSERFVYLNDDVFITDRLNKDFFFRNGLPSDAFLLNSIYFGKGSNGWTYGSNISVINDHFKLRKVMLKRPGKAFHYRYKIKKNVKNLLYFFLVDWFPTLRFWHINMNFLKQSFKEVWNAETEVLDETCKHRFRGKTDVSPLLIRNWQLATGSFSPISFDQGKCFHLREEMIPEVKRAIEEHKYKVICINDNGLLQNWEKCADAIRESFEKIYPERSEFELEDETV